VPHTAVYVRGLGGLTSARLLSWGRADQWWGLIAWPQHLFGPDGPLPPVTYLAWVPAERLSLPSWAVGPVPIPRVSLPADMATWPAPAGADGGWFIGRWDGTTALPAAPGIAIDDRPAWQRQRQDSPPSTWV
jgi:hypothetical protein